MFYWLHFCSNPRHQEHHRTDLGGCSVYVVVSATQQLIIQLVHQLQSNSRLLRVRGHPLSSIRSIFSPTLCLHSKIVFSNQYNISMHGIIHKEWYIHIICRFTLIVGDRSYHSGECITLLTQRHLKKKNSAVCRVVYILTRNDITTFLDTAQWGYFIILCDKLQWKYCCVHNAHDRNDYTV